MAAKTKTTVTATAQLAFETSIKIDVRNIKPNPYQPDSRIVPPPDVLAETMRSIKQSGLLQTPLARPEPGSAPGLFWEMGDGWIRRCSFLQLAIDTKDPSWYFMPVNVRELTNRQMADLIREANTVRHDLTPIDLAMFYKEYLEEFKITQTELAKQYNCSQGEINNTIRLLELPADIQARIISQEINETAGRQLLRLNTRPDMQKKLLERTIKEGLSVNAIANQIQSELYHNSDNLEPGEYPKPEFDTAACLKCDNRQKIGSPYSEERKSWRCMEKACYKKKQAQAEKDRVAKMQKEIDKANAAAAKAPGAGEPAAGGKKKGKAAAGSDGMVCVDNLNYNDFQRLDEPFHKIDNPDACLACPKRAIGRSKYGRSGPICIDVKCFKGKEKAAEDKKAALEKVKEQKLTDRVKAAGDAEISDDVAIELMTAYLLRHSRKDTRERFARMYGFKEHELAEYCFTEGKDAVQKKISRLRVITLVLQMERFEGDKGAFRKMLADLEGTGAELDKELTAHREKHCKGCTKDSNNCAQLLKRVGEGWTDRCYSRSEQPEPKKADSRIPAGIRIDTDVPKEECDACNLDSEDHTIGMQFQDAEGGIIKVCVKDYRAWEKKGKKAKAK